MGTAKHKVTGVTVTGEEQILRRLGSGWELSATSDEPQPKPETQAQEQPEDVERRRSARKAKSDDEQ